MTVVVSNVRSSKVDSGDQCGGMTVLEGMVWEEVQLSFSSLCLSGGV